MLEYVFFHQAPCDRFLQFLREEGVDAEATAEEGTWEVRVPEGLPEALSERVESLYDELLEMDQQLHEREAPAEEYHTAGVVLNLKNGETVYAQVEPALLSRIMSVLTPEEFGRVVNAIVDAVENPDPRTMCQRMRDKATEN